MIRWSVVVESNVSQRADLYLIQQWHEQRGSFDPLPVRPLSLTRSVLKQMMLDGQVTANAEPIKPNSKLYVGSQVSIDFLEKQPLQGIAQPLSIVYEDDAILVVNKQPNMVVHPSPSVKTPTLVEAVIALGYELASAAGEYRPGVVHRLDKHTSGALVLAKTDVAYHVLRNIFSQHQILRQYRALCYGKTPLQGSVRSLIGRNPYDRLKMSAKVKQGKLAVTHYKTLRYFGAQGRVFASEVLVTLETGRTHQVRVHMEHIGHSVLGDATYKTLKNSPLPEVVLQSLQCLPGQALHAAVLSFAHPITEQALHFETPLFSDFSHLISVLDLWEMAV